MCSTRPLLLSLFASTGLLACNPSDFNSILDKAPVLDLGTPGSSTGALFVLPMPAPDPATKVAARMLVSRKDSNFVGLADYDMNGKATLQAASAVMTAVGYPIYSSAMRADGMIILGTPSFGGTQTPPGRVSTLSVGSNADGSPSFVVQAGNPTINPTTRLGISVAAGNVTGAPTGDFVAVSDSAVHLFGTDPTTPIATSPATCLALISSTGEAYGSRPVVVADLLLGGLDEIVLGGLVPDQVLFVQYKGTSDSLCPTVVLANGSSAGFGTSLAVGDFDGDGHMDLAVGAPPNHVFVYFGPLDAATTAAASYDVDIAGSTPTQLGKQLSTYFLPGQAAAQLLVADPAGPSPGGVGKTMLFTITRTTPGLPGGTAQLVATLFDSDKDSAPGLFGLNLGGVPFNMGLCSPAGAVQLVPWASLGSDILTFFAYSGGPKDPRCFARQP